MHIKILGLQYSSFELLYILRFQTEFGTIYGAFTDDASAHNTCHKSKSENQIKRRKFLARMFSLFVFGWLSPRWKGREEDRNFRSRDQIVFYAQKTNQHSSVLDWQTVGLPDVRRTKFSKSETQHTYLLNGSTTTALITIIHYGQLTSYQITSWIFIKALSKQEK